MSSCPVKPQKTEGMYIAYLQEIKPNQPKCGIYKCEKGGILPFPRV